MSVLEAVRFPSNEGRWAGLHRLHGRQATETVAAVIEIRMRPWFIPQATPARHLARQEDPHLQCASVDQLIDAGAVPRRELRKAPIRVLGALKVLF